MGLQNKKIIWFLNQNSYLPEDGPHIRHYTLGKYLSKFGYESVVLQQINYIIMVEGSIRDEKLTLKNIVMAFISCT